MNLSESALLAALRRRYPAPEFAFIAGVRNSTGFSSTVRTADAVAMSLWRSRGLHLYGFELKSYRGDWLREKADPEKADEIAAFCSFWWIVAGGDEIVEPSELPGSWGLMVPTKTGALRTVVAAKLLEDPKPVTRGFLAAILRRAQEDAPATQEIAAATEAAIAAERKRTESVNEIVQNRTANELERLKGTISTFEAQSGLKIDRWSGDAIGNAVRLFRETNLLSVENELRYAADRMRGVATNVEALLDAVRELKKKAQVDAKEQVQKIRDEIDGIIQHAKDKESHG